MFGIHSHVKKYSYHRIPWILLSYDKSVRIVFDLLYVNAYYVFFCKFIYLLRYNLQWSSPMIPVGRVNSRVSWRPFGRPGCKCLNNINVFVVVPRRTYAQPSMAMPLHNLLQRSNLEWWLPLTLSTDKYQQQHLEHLLHKQIILEDCMPNLFWGG